ncbi:MAG: MetQ/NlpA family ABC transporter substrate-binding protein [Gordonia sp. (in: high G+C Gram-positive bacteria)]
MAAGARDRMRCHWRPVLTWLTTAVVFTVALTGCSSAVQVDYDSSSAGGHALRIYVGAGADRTILEYVRDHLLSAHDSLQLLDADADSNRKIADGHGDLAYFQHVPALDADIEKYSLHNLSVVTAVNVAPYALYSSKWKNLAPTNDWVNAGLVADNTTGRSLPHGSRVVLPATASGFARGLYLLQSAGLLRLDRPFGGHTVADLTITQANVLDSSRHLSLLGLDYSQFLRDLYQNYDAIVLNPDQATSLGLVPARDALAVEAGPRNPYAHVLVAPARLAGDPRVIELAHLLEDPRTAAFVTSKYSGTEIPVQKAAAS